MLIRGTTSGRAGRVLNQGLDLDPNPESCTLPLDQLAATSNNHPWWDKSQTILLCPSNKGLFHGAQSDSVHKSFVHMWADSIFYIDYGGYGHLTNSKKACMSSICHYLLTIFQGKLPTQFFVLEINIKEKKHLGKWYKTNRVLLYINFSSNLVGIQFCLGIFHLLSMKYHPTTRFCWCIR